MDEVRRYQHELAGARQRGDREGEKVALRELASYYAHCGQVELWVEHEKQALPIANEQGEHREVVEILNNIGFGCTDLDQNRLALQVLERALAYARAHDLRRHEGLVLVNLARVRCLADPNQGIATYHQAIDILRRFDEPSALLSSLGGIGWAEDKLGRPDRAIEWLERAVDLARQIEDQPSEGEMALQLALACGKTGQYKRAEEYLVEGISCFQSCGDMRQQAIGWDILATALSNQERLDDAAEALAQAREIFEALGMFEDVARCDHMRTSLGQKKALQETVDPVDRDVLACSIAQKSIWYDTMPTLRCETRTRH